MQPTPVVLAPPAISHVATTKRADRTITHDELRTSRVTCSKPFFVITTLVSINTNFSDTTVCKHSTTTKPGRSTGTIANTTIIWLQRGVEL